MFFSYLNLTKIKYIGDIMKRLYKLLFTIILTLICLICIKKNNNFKTTFYKKIYEDSFDFGYVNKLYKNYLGNILPLKIDAKPVFNEELVIESKEKYKDGVKVKTKGNLIPSFKEGLVIYIGIKEEYGNTVIISGSDGVDIWYSNIKNINVKLYDYIEKGTLLGESDELVLVYKKDGEVLNYNDYI